MKLHIFCGNVFLSNTTSMVTVVEFEVAEGQGDAEERHQVAEERQVAEGRVPQRSRPHMDRSLMKDKRIAGKLMQCP